MLLLVCILSLTSNLFFKLSINEAYVKGLLVDYLIPKIYLFDFLLLINLIIFFFLEKNYQIFQKIKIKFKKIDKLILFLLIIFFVNQLSTISLSLIIYFLRLILIALFVLSLYLDKKRQKLVCQALFISIVWQSFLAYYQFFNQQSLAPYYFFGESNLQHFASISRGQFLQSEKILPYGSTAHPNVLAGVISIFSIIVIDKKYLKRTMLSLILFNAFIVALLTQSLSALITLLIFLAHLLIKQWEDKQKQKRSKTHWQKILNLFLISVFITSPLIIQQLNFSLQKNYLSVSRRAMLNSAAWEMFLKKPIFGFGLGNFVRELENHSQHQEAVRFVQPVHHLGLLLLSEGGLVIIGILLLATWVFREKINWSKLLILAPIASLDHYLITQPLGLASLLLLVFFTRKRSRT